MDVTVFLLLISAVMGVAKAVKCHDCSSWNPYCREKVDEPFESAVAVVECEKTSTCFLKKDESGVINRGCADWWMESQVDIHYVGCQTQHVPWLGEMTWCFCKEDYCNGGSIEMMSKRIFPEVKVEKKTKWGDYDENWGDEKWTEDHAEKQTGSEMEQGEGGKEVHGKSSHGKIFDDVNPGWHGSVSDNKKSSDPKYQLWFWHADSDRPQWEEQDNNWRAPEWVEKDDGEGWDFPVTGDVHYHGDHEVRSTAPNAVAADNVKDDATKGSTTSWNWGNGWAHIKPWWLKDDDDDKVSTEEPRRWTHPPTKAPRSQDDGWAGLPRKRGQDRRDIVEQWGQNILNEIDRESDNGDTKIDIHDINDSDMNNVNLEISKEEFFCWDCYSDSAMCGETVDIVKAAYLGKSACAATHKCFVRKDNGVIYRGCADGWTNSVIDTNYVGCRTQKMWERTVEWCFCTASLCNGDSMKSIKNKYAEPVVQAFMVTEILEVNATANTNTTTTTTAATTIARLLSPFAAPASRYIKTESKHVEKRSTTAKENSTLPVSFHVETDTVVPSLQKSGTTEGNPNADDNTSVATSPEDWMTTEDRNDATATDDDYNENGNEDGTFMAGTNYKALFG